MSPKMKTLLDNANAILTEKEGETLSGYRFDNAGRFLVSSGRWLCTFLINMEKSSDTGTKITSRNKSQTVMPDIICNISRLWIL